MWKSFQVCAKINLHIKIAFLQEGTPNCNGLVGLKMVGLSFIYCSRYIFPIFLAVADLFEGYRRRWCNCCGRGSVMKIDKEKLIRDLEDYYGTAVFGGMPGAFPNMLNTKILSTDQLLQQAKNNGFNLNKYETDKLENWQE